MDNMKFKGTAFKKLPGTVYIVVCLGAGVVDGVFKTLEAAQKLAARHKGLTVHVGHFNADGSLETI